MRVAIIIPDLRNTNTKWPFDIFFEENGELVGGVPFPAQSESGALYNIPRFAKEEFGWDSDTIIIINLTHINPREWYKERQRQLAPHLQ